VFAQTAVRPIRPQLRDGRVMPLRVVDQLGAPMAVVDVGRGDDHRKEQAQGVEQVAALAALDLLAAIDSDVGGIGGKEGVD
jgi:hypothetical protein